MFNEFFIFFTVQNIYSHYFQHDSEVFLLCLMLTQTIGITFILLAVSYQITLGGRLTFEFEIGIPPLANALY